MLFVTYYKTSPSTAHTGRDRFKQTGGLPPEGVKLLGRWHHADGSGGFTLVDTNDPIALAKWAQEWNDVIVLESRPVLTDEQIAQAIGG